MTSPAVSATPPLPRARRPRPHVLVVTAALGALLAPAAHAQIPSFSVEISIDPLPAVGVPVEATIEFSGITPTSVTFFHRPVGTLAYAQQDAISQDVQGVFTAQLTGGVPLEGVEGFAEFFVDGVRLTEPRESPEEFPIRLPAFIVRVESDVLLPPAISSDAYRMVSVPVQLRPDLAKELGLDLRGDTPFDVFGDDFGGSIEPADYDPALWRILRFDPATGQYVDGPANVGPPTPGRGFWLAAAAGGRFDVEGAISSGVVFDGAEPFRTDATIRLEPGFNQVGNPFPFPVEWADVEGSLLVEAPIGFDGEYRVGQTVLEPWEGYFVFNPSGEPITLVVPPLATSEGVRGTTAERLLARAGPDGYVVELRAVAGGVRSDGAYVGLAAASADGPDPLDAHAPPPVRRGPRLAVREDARALAGSFRSPGGPQAWALDLDLREVPNPGAVTLTLDEHGRRPAGYVLTVEDLDRGGLLDVRGGEVVVPAATGVRHLLLRLAPGGAGADALSLDVPRPNPAAADAEVTFTFRLGAPGRARLEVFDVLGRRVGRLLDAGRDAGDHALAWDRLDATGRPLPAGVYVVRLTSGAATVTTRLTLLR